MKIIRYNLFSKVLDEMINIFSMYECFSEMYRSVHTKKFLSSGVLKKKEYIWLSNLFLVFCDKSLRINVTNFPCHCVSVVYTF